MPSRAAGADPELGWVRCTTTPSERQCVFAPAPGASHLPVRADPGLSDREKAQTCAGTSPSTTRIGVGDVTIIEQEIEGRSARGAHAAALGAGRDGCTDRRVQPLIRLFGLGEKCEGA
jgi:hypothetical protein